ncbi:antibiotic biosynthesis monooxygenase family protein [Microbulbifer sp. ANSA003]|uniref:antibiotic biosynthesis monooxygenase family protein n=1 Tax=unclassified Microbulbifer TaxID=2619833 RepID=UPI004039720D
MIAVIFEVIPNPEGRNSYFDIAGLLKPALSEIEGFISVERFQSLSNKDKYLSLSFWEDEAAVTQWKMNTEHQLAQSKGKHELFNKFRIRVGSILRDYGT